MSLDEFIEARKEWDRTKRQSVVYEPTISMEPGEELLRTKLDDVLRIARWFLDRKFSQAGVDFLGGEDEIIQNAMVYLLRWAPKVPVTLSTRVCKSVLWACGREKYRIQRRLEARIERKPFGDSLAVEHRDYRAIDQDDLDAGLWRRCARIVKSDRAHQILMRWYHGEDQTVMAAEQNVTRQMISLLMKRAEMRLKDKASDLVELNELFVGVK
ncbi:MAG: hypothetical protein E6Q97_20750 [Desulfurellales bacterium]|nr:MAG: hypothetical protein E6Q97_20750 [Desulfurellales bacterium]